ncbi:MAG TPA: tetratricopeptide repeat protein, partial [Gemmatimonadaceae bacterium]|nr:tetratricopeptide repeat protein [Gemmatimonadaceae bacterium]
MTATHSPAVALLLEEAERSERAGLREMARRRYETALYLLRPGDGATASMVVRRIARTYLDEGHFDAALDSVAAAVAIAEALDTPGERAHALNLLAAANVTRGDLDAAEPCYEAALAYARAAADELLEAMISQNLGILTSMRGDLSAALDYYSSSLATFRAKGLPQHLPPVLNNMG